MTGKAMQMLNELIARTYVEMTNLSEATFENSTSRRLAEELIVRLDKQFCDLYDLRNEFWKEGVE